MTDAPSTHSAHSTQSTSSAVSSSTPSTALSAHAIRVSFAGRDVLDSVSVGFEAGRMHAVVGPNGCGKTTLIRVLCGSLKPAEGQVFIRATPITQLSARSIARTMAIVWQGGHVSADLTVHRLIAYGRYAHTPWWKQGIRRRDPAVDRAMELTGVGPLAHRRVASLSGGERQRVWIATALAQEPEILILDEPTTYLDIAHQLEVLELVRGLNASTGLTVFTVLHDLGQAARFCDRVLVLGNGTVRADGPPRVALDAASIEANFRVDAWVTSDPERGYPVIAPRRTISAPASTTTSTTTSNTASTRTSSTTSTGTSSTTERKP